MSNITRLQNTLDSATYDALYVTDIVNVQWLTGFTGSSGTVVVTPTRACSLTDSRYTIQAKEQVAGAEVRWHQNPRTSDELLAEVLTDFGVKKLGFETSMSVRQLKSLKEKLDGVEWVEVDGVLKGLRMVKTPDEVARIVAACELAEHCLQNVLRMLVPGVKEFDISLDIEFYMRRHGAVVSFNPIVASGVNSARPHAVPSERELERGDFVTIDMGAKLDGYCSDITRTFVIGSASERHKEIYNQVLRAQMECCELCIPGASGKSIDGHARDVLREKELDGFFGHGLGHDPAGLAAGFGSAGRGHAHPDVPDHDGLDQRGGAGGGGGAPRALAQQGAAARGARCGPAGEPRQVGVLLLDEPRAAHPADLGAGLR